MYSIDDPTLPGFYWFEPVDPRDPSFIAYFDGTVITRIGTTETNSPVEFDGRWAGPLLEPVNANTDRATIQKLEQTIREAQATIEAIQAREPIAPIAPTRR